MRPLTWNKTLRDDRAWSVEELLLELVEVGDMSKPVPDEVEESIEHLFLLRTAFFRFHQGFCLTGISHGRIRDSG